MRLIVGLGNPGLEYAKTRHNVGFMVLARMAERHGLTTPKSKFHSQIVEGHVQGEKVMLMSPMTFMNKSGLAVGEAVRFHKLDPETEVMVIVDDIALPTGRLRFRTGGGAGGHNGLKDIQQSLGTQSYPRCRIGIDAPGRIPQIDYVLGKFTPQQVDLLEPVLDATCDGLEYWLNNPLELTMTKFNSFSAE